MDFHQLLELAATIVGRGWQGLMTLIVARWVYQEIRANRAEAEGKHNPSIEVHEAIDRAVAPINKELSSLGQRVARIEGKLSGK